MLEQVDIYIKGILIIVDDIKKAISQLEKIKKEMKRESDYTGVRDRLPNPRNFKGNSSVIADELL